MPQPAAPEIKDFEDTAAILMLADTLISIDSSPVHLAGALSRPAWVMLPFVAEWRWMLQRSDTPWYPTLKLFRQRAEGQWQAVMEALLAELERLAAAVKPPTGRAHHDRLDRFRRRRQPDRSGARARCRQPSSPLRP